MTNISKEAIAFVKARQLVLAAIVAVVSATSIAFATAGSGVILRNDFVRGSFVDPTDLKFKVTGQNGTEVVHVPNARETVFQQVVSHQGDILVGTAIPDRCS